MNYKELLGIINNYNELLLINTQMLRISHDFYWNYYELLLICKNYYEFYKNVLGITNNQHELLGFC